MDNGSTNGTLVNGTKVDKRKTVRTDVMARELRRREHSADKMSLTTESTPLLSRKREKQLAEEVERTVWIGLHPIVTLQHGSTTLYQVSYHIQ